eukprot:scaffold823_cov219-Amphora_coffeaeformis.AAC.18
MSNGFCYEEEVTTWPVVRKGCDSGVNRRITARHRSNETKGPTNAQSERREKNARININNTLTFFLCPLFKTISH